MPVHDDITDPRVAKAMAHPLRVRILSKLDERTASPSQLSDELDVELTHVSYHVRKLASLGLVELVRRTPRRGAIEHHYRAKVRPKITDGAWGELPTPVKRAMVGATLDQAGTHIAQAAAEGGFDRADVHLTRSPLKLDAEGWKAVNKALEGLMERVGEVVEESASRVKDDPDTELEPSTMLIMHFEGPHAEPEVLDGHKGKRKQRSSGKQKATA